MYYTLYVQTVKAVAMHVPRRVSSRFILMISIPFMPDYTSGTLGFLINVKEMYICIYLTP